MASADYLRVCIRGSGGHAAHPHRTQDTVVAAAACIMALQTIVSRNLDPLAFGVVSVVALAGASADNVIPAQVGFTVCVRALDAKVRASILVRVQGIVAAQASAYGTAADITPMYGCPVLVNDTEQTAFARQVAEDAFGVAAVYDSPPRTGSEDFSHVLQDCPGSFVFLGAGCPASPHPLHHACYDFNDEVLWMGAAFWTRLAECFLVPDEVPSAG